MATLFEEFWLWVEQTFNWRNPSLDMPIGFHKQPTREDLPDFFTDWWNDLMTKLRYGGMNLALGAGIGIVLLIMLTYKK